MFSKNDNTRKKQLLTGFTLLEIVVVTSIIMLLSVVVFVNYQGTEKDLALSRSVHKLSQDLRQVQEIAMSCQKTPLEFGEQVFPKGGYGMYFIENSDSYILFADCDGDHEYDDWGPYSCEDADYKLGQSCDETLEVISLEQGIKIKELQVDSIQVNELPITFIPPDPTIIISGADSNQLAEIILCLKDNENITKNVTINKVGLIDTD
jgi:type II secretory pathway pseudopilin PulG